MPMITIPKNERSITVHGYEPFIEALQDAYNLHQLTPNSIKWASVNTKLSDIGFPPSVVIETAKDHPQLAVSLHPSFDGKAIDGSNAYHAPLLLRDVQRWGLTSNELGNYQVTGWTGVPEEKEMFQQPRSLIEIIEGMDLKEALPDKTAVVEAIALLPIAPNREFATEFNPHIRFDTLDHSFYQIIVFNQDKVSAYAQLTQGNRRDIKDMDEKQTMYNWKADFVPDLSDIEKLMLPDSRGHMILIATPVEKPKPLFDLDKFGYGGGWHDYGDELMKGGPMRGSTMSFSPPSLLTQGHSVGDISIGRGSETGQGGLYEGELTHSRNGNPIIFHLRFLGIKPEQARLLRSEDLEVLANSISNYSRN